MFSAYSLNSIYFIFLLTFAQLHAALNDLTIIMQHLSRSQLVSLFLPNSTQHFALRRPQKIPNNKYTSYEVLFKDVCNSLNNGLRC